MQEGREAEAEAIIAVKKPLNAVTPVKSPAKKKEAVVEDAEVVKDSPVKPSSVQKSPAVKNTPASTKRKASDAAAIVREKVARVGSRSSPRASVQKQ